jgi:DNA polymerase-3 subunit delta
MPVVKKTEIKPIRQGGQVYVIAGKDEFLVKNECERLLDELIKPEQRTTGLWRTEGRDIQITNVLDELRTLPFLTDRRVVVIENADKTILKSPKEDEENKEEAKETTPDNRKILERYFDNPSSTGILVMTVSSWPSNTRLAKKLPKVGKLIEIGELKSSSLVSYIRNYARQQHSKELSYNAAQMLIELAGDEPGVLCSEIDKLAAYTNSAKAITEKDIAALVGRNRIFDAFEVIDSMTAGDTGKAFEKLRIMFQSDREAEYKVVGAFAWHFRRMFNASAMLKEGFSPDVVSKKLRIWNRNEFFETLKKMTLEKIGDCLRQLAEIDYRIKTGQTTAQTAIEAFIVNLATKNL